MERCGSGRVRSRSLGFSVSTDYLLDNREIAPTITGAVRRNPLEPEQGGFVALLGNKTFPILLLHYQPRDHSPRGDDACLISVVTSLCRRPAA